jgi:hypothetical protein
MEQSITLNVPLNMPSSDWEKVAEVYRTLDGWLADSEWPYWYGKEGCSTYITASAEPSGLVFSGEVDSSFWAGWVSVLCARLSLALGWEVHDAEL